MATLKRKKADGTWEFVQVLGSDIINDFNSHKQNNMHVHWTGNATGVNNLVVTYPAITAYSDGLGVSFKNTSDSTAAATININSLGPKAIVNSAGEPMEELKANGIYTLRYNVATGNFILQGEGGGISSTDRANLIAYVNSIYDK